jgi:hypothetical protein
MQMLLTDYLDFKSKNVHQQTASTQVTIRVARWPW